MNSKEDELSELQEQIEKYQSLLEITTSTSSASKKNERAETDASNLKKLYALAYGTRMLCLAIEQRAFRLFLTRMLFPVWSRRRKGERHTGEE